MLDDDEMRIPCEAAEAALEDEWQDAAKRNRLVFYEVVSDASGQRFAVRRELSVQ